MTWPGSNEQSQHVITKRGQEAMTGSSENKAMKTKNSHN